MGEVSVRGRRDHERRPGVVAAGAPRRASIVYEPRAKVRHSHAYSIKAAFRRFFDSGASADRAYVGRNRESRVALRQSGIQYAQGELTWLWRTGQQRWIPYAVIYESAKFAGLQLGLRHERIPGAVKQSFSGIPAHWERRKHPPNEQSDHVLRVCLVYDHLFPQTVGGAERLMRDLALHLVSEKYHVTYLTMRHWEKTETPQLDGVHVVALTRAGRIYSSERRTLLPPVRFGLAVARYLSRYGSEFDIVHIASFPYFPVLAAGAVRRRAGYAARGDLARDLDEGQLAPICVRLVVGPIGWFVQGSCVRLRHTAFCISQLHARRLVGAGFEGISAGLSRLVCRAQSNRRLLAASIPNWWSTRRRRPRRSASRLSFKPLRSPANRFRGCGSRCTGMGLSDRGLRGSSAI